MPQMNQASSAAPAYTMPAVANKIADAIRDEAQDEFFYRQLAEIAPNSETKALLIGIANQEKLHNRLFRRLYRQLTGGDPQALPISHQKRPSSYEAGVEQAIMGEIHAVEFYRQIHTELPAGSTYRDVLFEIMTDEINHQTKFLYLMVKGR